jgi:hypothetical protein
MFGSLASGLGAAGITQIGFYDYAASRCIY